MSPARLELCHVGLEHPAAHPAPEEAWVSDGRREPSLAELLEDPMLALLWASDGLDPAAARAMMGSLQAQVRDRCRRERQAPQGPRDAGTAKADLAA
jgi:hypothetical protein